MLGGSRGATLLRLMFETLLELRGFVNGAHSVPAYIRPICVGRFLRSARGSIQRTVAIAVPFQRVGHGSLLFGG